ncbi:MAG: hypothetical protein IJ168_03070 [Eubacterium sp.]|nr:hypothetical protein [Eubacterium sp.]
MTKTTKKKLIGAVKILAFLLAFAVLLEVFSRCVFTVKDAAKYNNKYANAYSYLLEPDNSLQVAAFGNSDLYSAIAPTVAWTAAGVTSTNVASPLQSVRQSYLMLQELLKTQHPAVVVIETDMLYKEAPDRGRDYSLEAGEKALDRFFDKTDPDLLDDFIKSKLSVFVFHDKWKATFKSSAGADRDLYSHGYHLSLKVKPFEPGDFMAPSDNVDDLAYAEAAGLQDMLDLCREEGIQVLLMEVPTTNSWSYERHNAMAQLAQEQGIDFLDFNLLWDELGLDASHDFRDAGNHANYYGAEKVSAYYGTYLRDRYGLEDRRGDPAYAYWDDTVENFAEAIEEEKQNPHNNDEA